MDLKINLNRKERDWLISRGGRDETDVLFDKEGKYVLMTNGCGKDVKVWIHEYPVDKVVKRSKKMGTKC